jgi:hypothetical protein
MSVRPSMKTVRIEASSMFEIEAIPGPCALCYRVALELKRVPGRCGDGICEPCDLIKFRMLNRGKEFVPWSRQKELAARKEAAQEAVKLRGKLLVPPLVQTVSSAMRRVPA